MKKLMFVLLMLLLSFTVSANAALVDNGNGTVTQTRNDGLVLMWLQNATPVSKMNWNNAMNWADTLVFADFDDWRLPSSLNSNGSGPCEDYNCSGSEMGYLYYTELGNTAGSFTNTGPFSNLQWNDVYWSNTENSPDPTWAWYFYNNGGTQGIYPKTNSVYSWAVRVVPEPISSTLFLIGGATLGFRRFRKII